MTNTNALTAAESAINTSSNTSSAQCKIIPISSLALNNPVEEKTTLEGFAPIIDYSNLQIGTAYTEDDLLDIKDEQAAEPIKNIEDIERLKNYLLSKGKYRDYLLMVVAMNTGLRYSDFIGLKFINFLDPDKLGTPDPFREELVIEEKKTRNTKKRRVNRHIAINNAIKSAISLYLAHNSNKELGDYIFTSESRQCKKTTPKPMTCYGVQDRFIRYATAIGLDINFGTHTFRKTMGYHFMMTHSGDPRALQQLQKMFNHSSETITLRYIGITADEIRESYTNLCL